MIHKKFTLIAVAMSMAVGPQAFAQGTAQSNGRPMASDHAPANPAIKSPDAITWGQLSKGHNSFTEGEARMRLEKAGYTKIAQLKMDKDGLWQANAFSKGKPVHAALDYKGNVAHR